MTAPESGASAFPCLGAGMSIDLYGARPHAFTVLGMDFSLPLAFPTVGLAAPNCYFLADLATTAGTFADGFGCASFRLNVPFLPPLRGLDLFSQWYVFDPAANAAGLVASNALSSRVQ